MKANSTREKIVELGRNLMQVEGYHSFNYKQIAIQLEIKNASIHHYFPVKEDLALAVIEKDQSDFQSFVKASFDLTPTEKVQALLHNYIQYFKHGKQLCVISTFGTSVNDVSDKIRQAASHYGLLVDKWFKEVLVDGLKSREFTFKDSLEGITALWMATLPGSLIVGRLHGEAYFDLVIESLKNTLKN